MLQIKNKFYWGKKQMENRASDVTFYIKEIITSIMFEKYLLLDAL